jgi:hypothetical protein
MRVLIAVVLGLAGVVACSGGVGSPSIEGNPQDPAAYTFESPGSGLESAGNAGTDSLSCVPCNLQYRCEGTIDGKRVEGGDALINLACGRSITLPSGSVTPEPQDETNGSNGQGQVRDAGQQQTRQDKQEGVSVDFRCGGAIEVANRRVGNWGKSPEGVLSVCIGALGSGNCLTCSPTGALKQNQDQSPPVSTGTPSGTGSSPPVDAGFK